MSPRKQRDGAKERFWRRVVRQWRHSGLSVRAFCVVGPRHFDVAIAMHLPLTFLEAGATLQRQRQQRRSLYLGEHLAHLLPGGAVQARVADGLLPVEQELILGVQAGKRSTLQRVLLHVVDAVFDLEVSSIVVDEDFVRQRPLASLHQQMKLP